MPVEIDELEGEETAPEPQEEDQPQDAHPVPRPTLPARPQSPPAQPLFGVYPALVTDIVDPEGQGRVRVRFPWAVDPQGGAYDVWARLATLMAGDGRGTWFVPDVDDEVLVAFQAGDPQRPYVVGALWNGQDAPPVPMDAGGQNHRKEIRSRSGVRISLQDNPGDESLVLETPNGNRITLDDGGNSVTLVDQNGNAVRLEASGITVMSTGQIRVSAATVEVSAGMVTVNAGMSRFSGVVQCDTLLANSVVSSSYTPGAGNIW